MLLYKKCTLSSDSPISIDFDFFNIYSTMNKKF